MEKNEKDQLVEVFAGTPWEAELVKGLLEANNIQAALRDETLGSVIAPGIGGQVLVLVNSENYTIAKKVIDERDTK